jgi:protein-disulfide isomerase
MAGSSNVRRFRLLALTLVCGLSAVADNGVTASGAIVVIDGKTFTSADVQRKNPGATFQARNTLFEAERKAADEFINDYVLEREAKNQNLTVDQLLERHAYNTLPKDPSDEALRVYYDGIDTAEPYESVREKIRDLVRQRRMAKAKAAYIQSLRSRAAITIRMVPPRAPVTIGDAPVRGASGAPVTIIEYADYECPYCQQIQPVIERIEKEYKDKVAFVFKDVPLPMHANAQKASEAAHCAGAQGKFWEYHDRLFTTQQYDVAHLREYARSLALDGTAFDKCLDTGAQAQRIKAYVAEAQAIALPGTPGFFVNGRLLSGAVDYETLRQAIDEELRASAPAAKDAAAVRVRE